MSEAPALSPSAELLSWLEAHADTPVILPFSVRRQILGLDGGDLVAEPAVDFKLDDSMMGVGLMERLLDVCSDLDVPCVVWLEGTFGEVMPLPGFEAEGPAFAVIRMHGLVEGTPTHARFPE